MAGHEQVFYVTVPPERLAVLIGPGGSTKKAIEDRLGVLLNVDSSDGRVEIRLARPPSEGGDPVALFKARDMVTAIASGFKPEVAMKLASDNVTLSVMDVSEHVGKDPEDVRRVMGRVIGAQGKTKRIIEETAHVDVAIQGDRVAIMGHPEDVEAAMRAVTMLVQGSPHSAVYRYLDQYAQRRKFSRRGLL
ncbi:MAG: KH domain-containing protein [Thaumarchaeota archaeon]|nr:KH domain-containing protein [Candidatus Calditenuaceae archaeon]MDW8042881.1 KH domain-containing protein [Nitrososphaerota archaeon]